MIKTTWNAWCNRCNWKSFVYESMITYICMFILAEEICVSGLGAAHKSPLSGGRDHCQLFPAARTAFLCLDSVAAHKDMFTTLTSRHSKKCSLPESSAPQPSIQRATASAEKQSHITHGILVGDKEKLHKSSWKLDDCSMCSSLSGDP